MAQPKGPLSITVAPAPAVPTRIIPSSLAFTKSLQEETYPRLSERQGDILAMAWNGMAAKDIAAELGVTVKTIEYHVADIREKWGALSLIELCRLGVKRGYLTV